MNFHATGRVEVDPERLVGWYQNGDIEDATVLVQQGYNLMVNTPVTLGPDGYIKCAGS
jgi:hypothetical protein